MSGKSLFTPQSITSAAIDVLGQLFVSGPTWDGNIVSKSGRNELMSVGLVDRINGWAFLTREGVQAAVEWKTKDRADQRWYRKAATLD